MFAVEDREEDFLLIKIAYVKFEEVNSLIRNKSSQLYLSQSLLQQFLSCLLWKNQFNDFSISRRSIQIVNGMNLVNTPINN